MLIKLEFADSAEIHEKIFGIEFFYVVNTFVLTNKAGLETHKIHMVKAVNKNI